MSLAKTLTVLAGCFFVFSGLLHASNPYFFMHSVASYRIVPESIVGMIGLFLPHLLIVVGVCLCFDWMIETVLPVALVIAVVFIAAQLTVLVRGMKIDCGCFGSTVSPVSVRSLMPSLFITAVCLLRLFLYQSQGQTRATVKVS